MNSLQATTQPDSVKVCLRALARACVCEGGGGGGGGGEKR